jgi:hypothetical protein
LPLLCAEGIAAVVCAFPEYTALALDWMIVAAEVADEEEARDDDAAEDAEEEAEDEEEEVPEEVMLNIPDWARMLLISFVDLTRFTWNPVPAGHEPLRDSRSDQYYSAGGLQREGRTMGR